MKIMFLMGGTNIPMNKEDYPLYLTEINEQLILEKQLCVYLSLEPTQVLFCVKAEDIKRFRVREIIMQIAPNAVVIPIHAPTKGAVCTALLGTEYIDNEEELLLLAVDDFIDDDVKGIVDYFRRNLCEAGVVSFTSVHPRYSFAKLDEAGMVAEVSEKRPISKNALVSFYYFRQGQDFVTCAKNVIRKDNPIEHVFYISQTLNEMILLQKKVGLYRVENDRFHSLKTEMQLAQYLADIKNLQESK